MKRGYLLGRSGVAFRYEQQGENEAAGPSSETNRATQENVAEKEPGFLPIGADKPAAQKERRDRDERTKRTSIVAKEDRKRRCKEESSSDSEDEADGTPTETEKAKETGGANRWRKQQRKRTGTSREKELRK